MEWPCCTDSRRTRFVDSDCWCAQAMGAEWAGDAGARYREKATAQQDDLHVVAEAAESIVALVTAAGDMAGSARAHIQESVTDCVNNIITRLPDY